MAWSDEARRESARVRRLKALMRKRMDQRVRTVRSSDWVDSVLPPAPGTAPIPPGTVRLYHQTSEDSARSIQKEGLRYEKAKGVEGPRAIYADEKGFYGVPGREKSGQATVEFYVPEDKWQAPNMVLQDVPVANIVGIHVRWHEQARYFEDNEMISEVLAGELDDLGEPGAIAYIKNKYRKKGSRS